ncbi:MAG: hypothetical protein CMC18_09795 [Flavobacteriaceae bacterium]|nr:hypothetical protein [Flavobacteriaceae bacterium]
MKDIFSSTLKTTVLTFLIVAFGLLLDLYFIQHYENFLQLLPILGIWSLLIIFAIRRRLSNKFITTLMIYSIILIALIGLLGVFFHLKANFEFEKEIYVNETTINLLINSFSGALPVFAPGSLLILSLLGMLYLQLTSKI